MNLVILGGMRCSGQRAIAPVIALCAESSYQRHGLGVLYEAPGHIGTDRVSPQNPGGAKVKLLMDLISYEMNITSLRPKFIKYTEPIASFFIRLGVTPNQVSVLSLLFGFSCALAFAQRWFLTGSLLLVISAVLDLVDGNVARRNHTESKFGAVFDWVADKYVDATVILGVGLSGIPIVSHLFDIPVSADLGIVGLALTGSLLNTFIKPVTYAEIGYTERVAGKIEDPLEGVGFFGRPETVLALVLGGVTGYIGAAVLLIAVCTNLSAIQRMIYLYRRYS